MLPLQVIKLNSIGPAVAKWQRFLLEQGFNIGSGGADGGFGNFTLAATIAFQQAHQLTADGVVGNATYGVAMLLGFNGVLDMADFLGIDVSHHDGDIDWNAVKADAQDIRFAYVKASEGATVQDSTYSFNIQAATTIGLGTGAYHFYSLTSSPENQAANFIQQVGQNYPYKLPPMLDYEKDTNSSNVAATIAALKTLLNLIQQQWGIRPIIYTSKNYWGQLNNPAGFDSYLLWLANYNTGLPALPGDWLEWAIWQYTESGTVQGINAAVDLNRYNINAGLSIV